MCKLHWHPSKSASSIRSWLLPACAMGHKAYMTQQLAMQHKAADVEACESPTPTQLHFSSLGMDGRQGSMKVRTPSSLASDASSFSSLSA